MRPEAYRRYLLWFVTILYSFNIAENWALGIALQDIKVDFHLTDTQLGFLGGLAFSVFYAAFGIPMGRWADRGDRARMLAWTRVLWAALVMLTGRCTSFAQLVVVRMGVAVGESGCLPPAYSLISDYFSREERPAALGFFFLGGPAASLVAYLGGGWLNQLYGWRVMFMVIGFTGLLLAPVAWVTLREPRKQASADRSSGTADVAEGASRNHGTVASARRSSKTVSLKEAFQYFYSNATYRNLTFVFVVNYIITGGLIQWQPAFFIRSYGLSSSVLGMWLAVVYGVTGMIGSYVGGRVATRWAGGNERLQLQAVAVANCVPAFLFPLIYLTHSYLAGFLFLGLANMPFWLIGGPLFAPLQAVVPSRLRAMSVMILFFFANLIGAGLGPLVVGALSDRLQPIFGEQSLRYALLATSPWFFLAGWFGWRASRSVVRDMEIARQQEEHEPDGSALPMAVTQ